MVSVEVLDDDTPAITFTTNALTVVETASNVVLTVRRQASAVGAFNANYATVDGTAIKTRKRPLPCRGGVLLPNAGGKGSTPPGRSWRRFWKP